MLAVGGRHLEAIAVCRNALRYEPTCEDMTRRLYNLHVENGDNVQARKVFSHYSEALENHGFSPEERTEILDAFWDDQN